MKARCACYFRPGALKIGSEPFIRVIPSLRNHGLRPIRNSERVAGEMTKRDVALRTGIPTEIGQGPVRMRITRTGQEANIIELRVEYDKAEVPARAYYADYSAVIKGRSGISLIFGKLKPGTSVLRTKVEIVFPVEMFIRQLWTNSRDLYEKTRLEYEKHPLEAVSDLVDTDTVQAFRANNVMAMAMSEEALLDFYYIAPSEVHYAYTKRRTEVALDPVIRIVMSSSLLHEMLEGCKAILERIPDSERIIEGV